MPLAVVGVLASGCTDPNTTSYDPVGAAAAEANLDLVPHEQIASCVEATKFGAYVGDAAALDRLIGELCARAGVETRAMPVGVRLRETGRERFWFNYGAEPVETEAGTIPAAGVLRTGLPGR